MIATEREQLGFRGDRRYSLAHSQLLQCLRHLLLSNIIINRCYRDISAIHDLGPVLIWIDVCSRIVAAERVLATGCVTNTSWTKSCTGSIRHGGVEWSANNSDVVGLGWLCQAFDMIQVRESANAAECPLSDFQSRCSGECEKNGLTSKPHFASSSANSSADHFLSS